MEEGKEGEGDLAEVGIGGGEGRACPLSVYVCVLLCVVCSAVRE